MRYSCGHVSTKKNVRGIKDAATSTPPQLRSSRNIRYRDNIGYPRYGERYDIGDNQYSSNNLSYCPINRFLESVPTLKISTKQNGGKINLTDNKFYLHGSVTLLYLTCPQTRGGLPFPSPVLDSETALGFWHATLSRPEGGLHGFTGHLNKAADPSIWSMSTT